MDIRIWKDTLQIPPPADNSRFQFSLEKRLGFTTCIYENELVCMISGMTSNEFFTQYYHFFQTEPVCYIAPSTLIEERIYKLHRDPDERDHNEVGNLLHEILEKGLRRTASDLHINRNNNSLEVFCRIHGKLEFLLSENTLGDKFFNKVKVLSSMDLTNTVNPQDGSFEYFLGREKAFDIRTSLLPCIDGEKLVMRVLPKENVVHDLDKLNFTDEIISKMRSMVKAKSGLVTICGATGSGKSTTLYAIINELKKRKLNIVTVEDPVEMKMEGITQVKLNRKIGFDIPGALKYILRQDPDVILVGEIRDSETAELAVSASMTGHIVLTTVHGSNPFEGFKRIMGFNIKPVDLIQASRGFLYQELVILFCDCNRDVNCIKCLGSNIVGRVPLVSALEGFDSFPVKNILNDEKFDINLFDDRKFFSPIEDDINRHINIGNRIDRTFYEK